MDEVNETTLTTGAFTIEDNSTSNNDINVMLGVGVLMLLELTGVQKRIDQF